MNRKFLRMPSLCLNQKALILAAALTLALCATGWAQNAAPTAAPAAAEAASANAEGANTNKVGIVNIQSAIITSNEGQRDFQELQKKFDPKRQELESLNTEIQDLQKKFSTQGDKLSDEARGTMLKDIDSKKKQLQRNYEDANTDVQQQQNEIANRIGQKMIQVLDKYAKEHGYSVILDVSGQQSPVLWATSSIDITKELVDAYNASSGVAAPVNHTGSTPAPQSKPATKSSAKPLPSAPTPRTVPSTTAK